jgi:RNA polymerase sigma-70 factor (ECF subfamily)
MISVAEAAEAMTEAAEDERRATFLRLIEQYHAAIERLAAAYVATSADREDLVQEIATELWKAIPGFRGDASERTWLYRIAHNTAVTTVTKLRKRQGREWGLDTVPEPAIAAVSDDDLIRAEKRGLMIAAIRELPVSDRQIVLLHLEGLNYAEIQEISGLSEGAIATRLSRIRDKLTQQIRKMEAGRR